MTFVSFIYDTLNTLDGMSDMSRMDFVKKNPNAAKLQDLVINLRHKRGDYTTT